MSIKKTLLAFAAMALALGAFASSAMAATDGEVYHIGNGTHPETLHFEGPAEFNTLGTGIECTEVTATVKLNATGTTGEVTKFVPTTGTCEGFGFIYEGCEVVTDETILEENHVTVTPDDFDINGTTIINSTHDEECAVPETQLEFTEEITVWPIGTELDPEGNHETVGTNEPIAGVELETEGIARNAIGEFGVNAEAVLTLTPSEQCTYAIRAA